MAIAKIKCLRVIGVKDRLLETADALVSMECFEPDDPLSFHSDIKMFVPVSAANPYSEDIEKFNAAVSSVDIKCRLKPIPSGEITDETLEKIRKTVDEINEFADKRIKLEDEIATCEKVMEQLKHFLDLDVEIGKINECRYIKANFGKLPKESFEKMQEYSDNPFVIFFPCSTDDDFYWGLYISPMADSDEVDRIFSELYFESCGVLELDGKPSEYYKEQEEKLPKLRQKLENLKAEFEEFKKKRSSDLDYYHSCFTEQQRKYDVMAKTVTFSKSFMMVGWIPAEKADEVVEKLSSIETLECKLTDGKAEMKHCPPVRLKNNIFTRAFSYFTEMYGLPGYNEFDPTAFVAITYTVLFGIMFGDLGHGLVVALVGLFMSKKLKNPIGAVLVPCGISGAVFGVLYGSVFGNEEALDWFYVDILHFDGKPIEVMSAESTNIIIYGAIGIGIALVLLAMLLNIFVSLKTNDKEEGIFGCNGIAGFVLYGSVIAMLISSVLFQKDIASPLYIICLIVVPLLLIFLKEPLGRLASGKKDWQPESWGGYCVQSFFELFEYALSYLSNTMSFLRVGAFVLVHAGMMFVVFTLAEMTSGFGYWAIMVFGNAFVIGLEALLVCIQVLRLEYYEMFGRFYKGSGRPFKPVKSLTE